jgi:pSer/pThr/pTyr-binding forkhead associated (FHA) protein
VQRARWLADLALGRIGEPEARRVVGLKRFGTGPSCRIVLGRSRSCDVTLDECPSVSRRHAELSLRAGTWTLRDLGSRNGTWLGARRVDVALLDPAVPLRFGGLEVRWTGL